MTVGIIVPNYNQRKLVEEVLPEFERLSFRDFKLYVFDCGSREDQKVDDLVEKYDWAEWIDIGKNLGFAGGNNVGIKRIIADGAEFVWLVNNDVRLDPECLGRLVEYMQNNPETGAVAPKIYYAGDPDQDIIWYAGGIVDWSRPYPFSVCTHVGEREKDTGQYNQVVETGFVTGASMMVRADVAQKTGGFDERYFAYFEDSDWSLRIQKLGYKTVYCANARMWHMVGMLSGVTSPRSSYYQIRNSLLFVWDWGPWKAKLLALANAKLILVKNLIKFFIPSKRSFAIAQLKAVIDFYRSNFGVKPL